MVETGHQRVASAQCMAIIIEFLRHFYVSPSSIIRSCELITGRLELVGLGVL